MNTNRLFLKFSSKRKHKVVASKVASLRKPSVLAGSIAVLAASVMSLITAPAASGATYVWGDLGSRAKRPA